MPFGLTNAPLVFQTLVNDVLCEILERFVFFYLNNILIFSNNMEEHIKHVELVLTRLLEARFFVKCVFHAKTV